MLELCSKLEGAEVAYVCVQCSPDNMAAQIISLFAEVACSVINQYSTASVHCLEDEASQNDTFLSALCPQCDVEYKYIIMNNRYRD